MLQMVKNASGMIVFYLMPLHHSLGSLIDYTYQAGKKFPFGMESRELLSTITPYLLTTS